MFENPGGNASPETLAAPEGSGVGAGPGFMQPTASRAPASGQHTSSSERRVTFVIEGVPF
jgi:hypothetical protein